MASMATPYPARSADYSGAAAGCAEAGAVKRTSGAGGREMGFETEVSGCAGKTEGAADSCAEIERSGRVYAGDEAGWEGYGWGEGSGGAARGWC